MIKRAATDVSRPDAWLRIKRRPYRIFSFAILSAGLLWSVPDACAQSPLNLDFELATAAGLPRYWHVAEDPQGVSVDSTIAHTGASSLRLQASEQSPNKYALCRLAPGVVAGHRLRISAFIRTDQATGPGASLACWAHGPGGRIAGRSSVTNAVSLPKAPVRGTTGWSRYELECPIDSGATSVLVAVSLQGPGIAWFDTLAIQVDGLTYEEAAHSRLPDLTPSEQAWLRHRARPIVLGDKSKALHSFDTLRPFLGDRRVIAFGEATHGTEEFQRARYLIVGYLATKLGFETLVLEEDFPLAARFDEYIHHGTGSPSAALEGASQSFFNTESFRALLEQLNKQVRAKETVFEVWGCDIQAPAHAMDYVCQFLKRADPALATRVEESYALLPGYAPAIPPNSRPASGGVLDWYVVERLEPQALKSAADATAKVVDLLVNNRARLARLTTDRAMEAALQYARVAHQGLAFAARGCEPAYREKAMAENIEWIYRHATNRRKMVIWAHNHHVARGCSRMGDHLARMFRDELAVVVGAVSEGRYRAAVQQSPGELVAWPLAPAHRGTIEAFLRLAGAECTFLDVRNQATAEDGSGWLKKRLDLRSVSVFATELQFDSAVPGADYDAILFVRESHPTQLFEGHLGGDASTAARVLGGGKRETVSVRVTTPTGAWFLTTFSGNSDQINVERNEDGSVTVSVSKGEAVEMDTTGQDQSRTITSTNGPISTTYRGPAGTNITVERKRIGVVRPDGGRQGSGESDERAHPAASKKRP